MGVDGVYILRGDFKHEWESKKVKQYEQIFDDLVQIPPAPNFGLKVGRKVQTRKREHRNSYPFGVKSDPTHLGRTPD
jgi:hypothetical protein